VRRIAIARITGSGLTGIALSVVLLWSCIISERLIVKNANVEARRTLQEMRMMRLRRHLVPVSAPGDGIPRHVRPDVG
jgi:hypothetical protein